MVYLIFDTYKLFNEIYKDDDKISIVRDKDICLVHKIFNKRTKSNPPVFIFPNKIKIKPEVVGLIVGEGFINGRIFIFANSNKRVIREVKEFMSQFKIDLKSYLEISTKNVSKGFIESAKIFWERILNNKIQKIRCRREFNNATKFGTIHLCYYNTFFSRLLSKIIRLSKKRVESNKRFAEGYIKGILAAEGNINVKKTTKCLYLVRISAKKKEEREHYKKILNKCGIKIYCKDMPTISKEEGINKGWKTKKGRSGAVLINRWFNFYKILSMDLLEIHEDKKQHFIKHFLNNKTTKWLLEFRDLPNKNFTMEELRNLFKLRAHPRCRINKMLSLGFIKKRMVNKKSRKVNIYCLTKNYFEFLNNLFDNTPSING